MSSPSPTLASFPTASMSPAASAATSATPSPPSSSSVAPAIASPITTFPPPRVILVGAGLTGPLLAQQLSYHRIPFTLHERDPTPTHRGAGWGLTLHWALPAFLSLLPEKLHGLLEETYVNPLASAKGENGNFLLFDVRTGGEMWRVPPNRRIRCRREGVRRVLVGGVDVNWGSRVVGVRLASAEEDVGVEAEFEDGRVEKGDLVIGCDGSRSRVREILCPETYRNLGLEVRLLGVSCVYSAEKAREMRKLDPFFLQGTDQVKGVFFWFSFLDTPPNDPPQDGDTFTCQILTSYPFRPGFLDSPEPTEAPSSSAERLKLMKRFAENWAEPFRSVVLDIPDGTEVKQVRLEDWAVRGEERKEWEGSELRGRVTLVGDAAHAMTMYRGEAANHGITDCSVLLTYLLPALQSSYASVEERQKAIQGAVKAYEEEMWARTPQAVELSTRACLDANGYGMGIHQNSPVVARRAVKLEARGDGGISATTLK